MVPVVMVGEEREGIDVASGVLIPTRSVSEAEVRDNVISLTLRVGIAASGEMLLHSVAYRAQRSDRSFGRFELRRVGHFRSRAQLRK